MRKGIRRSAVLLLGLLPLAGCLDGIDVDDYVQTGTGSSPPDPPPPARIVGRTEARAVRRA